MICIIRVGVIKGSVVLFRAEKNTPKIYERCQVKHSFSASIIKYIKPLAKCAAQVLLPV